MADPKKPETPITPDDVTKSLSNFDPEALTGDPSQAGGYPGQDPSKSGPPTADSAEQKRREEQATVEHNAPNLDRKENLTRIGRGQDTHG